MWLARLLEVCEMKKTPEQIEWDEATEEWEAIMKAFALLTELERLNTKSTETEERNGLRPKRLGFFHFEPRCLVV